MRLGAKCLSRGGGSKQKLGNLAVVEGTATTGGQFHLQSPLFRRCPLLNCARAVNFSSTTQLVEKTTKKCNISNTSQWKVNADEDATVTPWWWLRLVHTGGFFKGLEAMQYIDFRFPFFFFSQDEDKDARVPLCC